MKKKTILVPIILSMMTYALAGHAEDNTSDQIQMLNSQIQAQLQQMQETQQKELKELNMQLQTQLKKMQTDLQEKIQTLNTQTQEQMKTMQTELQTQIKQVYDDATRGKTTPVAPKLPDEEKKVEEQPAKDLKK